MKTINRSQYLWLKMVQNYKNKQNQTINISDEEYENIKSYLKNTNNENTTPITPNPEPEQDNLTPNPEPEQNNPTPEIQYDYKNYDFGINGIGYKIISLEERTVSMTLLYNYDNTFIMPEEVIYDNISFKIININYDGYHEPNLIVLNKYVNTDINSNICYYKNVNIDENNPYLIIVNNALYSKDLTRLICVFNNIKEYIMPNNVLYVNDNAFPNNIEKIIFNDNVENLPLLGPPEKLQYLKLSNKIKNINCKSFTFAYVFPKYFSLKELILPRDLETLNPKREQYYDYLPSTLEKITIYNSNIINYKYLYTNDYIFNNLVNLKELYVLDTNPIVSNTTIFSESQYFKLKIYVPKGCKEIYENTEGWNKFYNIIEE